jgi:hypothetical protein
MSVYRSVGWDMYDPRMTIKATVLDGLTDIFVGDCCRIDSNGYITTDLGNGANNRVHGLALTTAKALDKLVLVTHGRLKVEDTQADIGDLVNGPNTTAASSPNTALTGHPCGFAIEAKLLFIHIDNLSGAES